MTSADGRVYLFEHLTIEREASVRSCIPESEKQADCKTLARYYKKLRKQCENRKMRSICVRTFQLHQKLEAHALPIVYTLEPLVFLIDFRLASKLYNCSSVVQDSQRVITGLHMERPQVLKPAGFVQKPIDRQFAQISTRWKYALQNNKKWISGKRGDQIRNSPKIIAKMHQLVQFQEGFEQSLCELETKMKIGAVLKRTKKKKALECCENKSIYKITPLVQIVRVEPRVQGLAIRCPCWMQIQGRLH